MTTQDWINVGLLATTFVGVGVAIWQAKGAAKSSREASEAVSLLRAQTEAVLEASTALESANDIAIQIEKERRRDDQYPERRELGRVMDHFLFCSTPGIRGTLPAELVTSELDLREATLSVRDKSARQLERWLLARNAQLLHEGNHMEGDWAVIVSRTRRVIRSWVDDPDSLHWAMTEVSVLDREFPPQLPSN